MLHRVVSQHFTDVSEMLGAFIIREMSIVPIVVMMKAVSTFETSLNFYQTTRLNNPEDSNIHVVTFPP
jgi:hypothetical protein